MGIYLNKKKEKDSPKSWTFEESFAGGQKSKIPDLLFTLIFLLCFVCVFNYCRDIKRGTEICLAVGIAIFLIECLFYIFLRKERIKKYMPLAAVPAAALVIIFGVMHGYVKSDTDLQASDILSFCGSFLTFLGAFCLGYFLYIQEQNRIAEEKRMKVKLLVTLINNADMALLDLRRLLRNKEYIRRKENRACVDLIPYNENWLLYYQEYEALKGENRELRQTLQLFFNNVQRVNMAIRNGQIEMAGEIYERHIEQSFYSISKYNELEAVLCLQSACHERSFYNTKSWIERKETIDLINDLCRRYYRIIENYVYVWLLRRGVRTTTENDDLNREIVDWLLTSSPEIKKIVKFPSDKRIISKVVFDCSVKFERKSQKVGYVWGEYSLKM